MPQIHKPNHLNFIKANWRSMDDQELAFHLNLSKSHVQKLRGVLDLNKYMLRGENNKNLIAGIIEMFSNGHTIVSIAQRFKIDDGYVTRQLNKHFFKKKIGLKTEIITLPSKV